jgi:carboxypeptidase family protein
MKGVKNILLSLSILPLSILVRADDCNIPGFGKTDPVLHGSITDASTKKPVAGVHVVVYGNKTTDKRAFTTDASGNFRIAEMPSGEVTIILEKKGYKTFRRERVIIKEGLSIQLNLDLKSDDRAEDTDYFHPLMRMLEGN